MADAPGTVRLSFQPFAVHVRTARLVAATVARRSGWPEDLIESVRLAVGEGCALALRAASASGRVTLEIDDADGALTAWVWPVPDVTTSADDALPRAVLVGLTDESLIEHRDGQVTLRLSWKR